MRHVDAILGLKDMSEAATWRSVSGVLGTSNDCWRSGSFSKKRCLSGEHLMNPNTSKSSEANQFGMILRGNRAKKATTFFTLRN
jgi:hypothetical protein